MTDVRQPDFEWRGLQIWINAPGSYRISMPRGFTADIERVIASPRFRQVLRERFPQLDFDETEPPIDTEALRTAAVLAALL